jgi:hypothetical protein
MPLLDVSLLGGYLGDVTDVTGVTTKELNLLVLVKVPFNPEELEGDAKSLAQALLPGKLLQSELPLRGEVSFGNRLYTSFRVHRIKEAASEINDLSCALIEHVNSVSQGYLESTTEASYGYYQATKEGVSTVLSGGKHYSGVIYEQAKHAFSKESVDNCTTAVAGKTADLCYKVGDYLKSWSGEKPDGSH